MSYDPVYGKWGRSKHQDVVDLLRQHGGMNDRANMIAQSAAFQMSRNSGGHAMDAEITEHWRKR